MSMLSPAEPSAEQQAQLLLTCESGGRPFAIAADHLAGVFQMTSEQCQANDSEYHSPHGTFPVVSLSELLAHHLGIELSTDDNEDSLIAFCFNDERAALRVKHVSEPIHVPDSMVHPIPRIAYPADKHHVIKAVTVTDALIETPDAELRLVIDPLAALGFASGNHDTTGRTTHESVGTVFKGNTCNHQRGSQQLLIFVPDEFDQSDCSFCLPLAAVAEVISMPPMLRLPITSRRIVGYVLWRRIPVPIVDLSVCFGFHESGDSHPSSSDHPSRRLVIARTAPHRYLGFSTHAQVKLVQIPPVVSQAKLDGNQERPSLGEFETEYGFLVIPDLSTILDQVD